VVREHEHRGAQPHTGGPGRHEAEERQRLVVGPAADPVEDVAHVEHVVVHPHGVEPDLLGADRQVDERVHVVDPLVVEQGEPESHAGYA
jgi:hypothetical protein